MRLCCGVMGLECLRFDFDFLVITVTVLQYVSLWNMWVLMDVSERGWEMTISGMHVK
jgi:hypothetical protein